MLALADGVLVVSPTEPTDAGEVCGPPGAASNRPSSPERVAVRLVVFPDETEKSILIVYRGPRGIAVDPLTEKHV